MRVDTKTKKQQGLLIKSTKTFKIKPKLSKSFFINDNRDNIPLESTSSSGKEYYYQQLKQHKPTTLRSQTTQLALEEEMQKVNRYINPKK